MTQTTNLGLNLFADSDPVLVANINANTQKLDKLPQVVSGTFSGNGGKGSANAVRLNFSRKPVLLFVGAHDYLLMGMRGLGTMLTRLCLSTATAGNETVNITWGNNYVSFYSDQNASTMCNDGRTYSYVAVLADTD